MDCLRFCLIYCWLNTNQMEVKILSATIQYEAGFVEKLWQRFSARRWSLDEELEKLFPLIQLTYSDPGSSVTTTPISCSDQRCSWGVQSSNSCSSAQNNICAYTFQYGDGSCTSGFFVSGVLQFDIRLITMTLGQTY
ncbi:unnamed protein product, partial [Brassica rapa]